MYTYKLCIGRTALGHQEVIYKPPTFGLVLHISNLIFDGFRTPANAKRSRTLSVAIKVAGVVTTVDLKGMEKSDATF